MNKALKYKLINETNQFLQIIHYIEDIQSSNLPLELNPSQGYISHPSHLHAAQKLW